MSESYWELVGVSQVKLKAELVGLKALGNYKRRAFGQEEYARFTIEFTDSVYTRPGG
jgi:hypothetical protein